MTLRFVFIFSLLFFSGLGQAQTVWHLKLKKYKVAALEAVLDETSGLTFHQGRLYTLNDGGNQPAIYEISPDNGKIIKSVNVNASNTDWESLSSDGTHLYIGDIGNNPGDRKDLKFLKVNLSDSLTAGASSIYYPDQKDFTPRHLKHNCDAEAAVFHGDEIHIFSKEWQSRKVTHYTILPSGALHAVEKYRSRFMVTGAEVHDRFLYLVGYTKKAEVFLLRFKESSPGIFFKDKPRLYFLGMAFSVGQIEAIAANEKGLYLTGEKFHTKISKVPPTLYFVPFKKLK